MVSFELKFFNKNTEDPIKKKKDCLELTFLAAIHFDYQEVTRR
jgi:hypothetical protein